MPWYDSICLDMTRHALTCLDMPWYDLICLDMTRYALTCLDMPWHALIWLDMPWYALTCLDMPWYDSICLDMPVSKAFPPLSQEAPHWAVNSGARAEASHIGTLDPASETIIIIILPGQKIIIILPDHYHYMTRKLWLSLSYLLPANDHNCYLTITFSAYSV